MTENNHLGIENQCKKPILITEIIDELVDLGTDIFDELVELFLSETPTSFQAIETAFENHDLTGLQRAAHSMKGACINMGAGCMAEICQDIEDQCKIRSVDGLEESIRQLRNTWLITQEKIKLYPHQQ